MGIGGGVAWRETPRHRTPGFNWRDGLHANYTSLGKFPLLTHRTLNGPRWSSPDTVDNGGNAPPAHGGNRRWVVLRVVERGTLRACPVWKMVNSAWRPITSWP